MYIAIFVAFILALFWLDRDRDAPASPAVWIAVVWLLIAGSRNVGEWVQLGAPIDPSENAYLEGNPIDREALGGLMLIAILVLARRRRVLELLRANWPIVLYYGYCAASILWSDYPEVTSRRLVRALGDPIMVLLVVSDPQPLAAIKRFLGRAGFVLLPLSILFIRYYPFLGRSYNRWDGTSYWTGVTTGKNLLGMICTIFALAAGWRVLELQRNRGSHNSKRKRLLLAHGVTLAMALWLISKAHSATSLACTFLAGAVLVLSSQPTFIRKTALLHAVVAVVISGAAYALFFDSGGRMVETVGRDSSLTGRTEVWQRAFTIDDSPVLGAGYETFWLGKRLEEMRVVDKGLNQAHNGYIEVYLNLGAMGLVLLGTAAVNGYRRILRAVQQESAIGCLRLAYFVLALVYNFTEGAFKMMFPVWITFLLAVLPSTAVQSEEHRKSTQLFWQDSVSLKPAATQREGISAAEA